MDAPWCRLVTCNFEAVWVGVGTCTNVVGQFHLRINLQSKRIIN